MLMHRSDQTDERSVEAVEKPKVNIFIERHMKETGIFDTNYSRFHAGTHKLYKNYSEFKFGLRSKVFRQARCANQLFIPGALEMTAQIGKSREVDEYISSQSHEAQKALNELRSCIWLSASVITVLMNYNIPAFALVKGGRRVKQSMIFGYVKNAGFYPHPSTIEAFSERLYHINRQKIQCSFQ